MENLPVSNKGPFSISRIEPEKEIEFASRCARNLKDIVLQAGLSKKLGGEKEYLEFEAWQTVAQFYNAGPRIEWTKEILDSEGHVIGYNSRASLSRTGRS